MIKHWRCLLALAAFLNVTAPASAKPSLKALVVDGQNNHQWQETTPILKKILEECGLFSVDVATSPARGHDVSGFRPAFAAYDVIVLNYNGAPWSQSTETAFIEYVRQGGGVVVYHAADNSFPQWREYNEIIGLGGWGDRNEKDGPMVRWRDGKPVLDDAAGAGGTHGPQHAFQVIVRNRDHAITRGLPERWMHAPDELYSKLRGPAKNLEVLATAYADPAQKGTGEHEPCLFTIRYGQGRVFHTILGHDANSARCAGFIVTLQRGAEWAATGGVTLKVPDEFPQADKVSLRLLPVSARLDAALKDAVSYRFGEHREVLTRIEDIVYDSLGSAWDREEVADGLARVLRTEASFECKQFLCRQLALIGSPRQVPILAGLLGDERMSDMARYALAPIRGGASDRAFLDGLERTQGKTRIGIINSLGERRTEKAIEPLATLLKQSDKETATACAAALVRIGGVKAAGALTSSLEKAGAELRPDLVDACLSSADRLRTAGEPAKAKDIYQRLYRSAKRPSARAMAFLGMVRSSPSDEGLSLVLEKLRENEPEMLAAAIRLVREVPGGVATKAFANELKSFSPESQISILRALSDRGDREAIPAVENEVKNVSPEVRMAALRALGVLGDESTVDLLAERAALTNGVEQETARESLAGLRGPAVDSRIIAALSKPSASPVRAELARCLGPRRAHAAVPVLLGTAMDPDHPVRMSAIRSLGDIAGEKDMPALVNLLVALKDESQRSEVQKAVIAASRRIPKVEARSQPALQALAETADPAVKSSLLAILGRMCGPAALKAVCAARLDPNAKVREAAIRSLLDWEQAEALDSLLDIVKTGDKEAHTVLALRSYFRLLRQKTDRPDSEMSALYKQALSLATEDTARKQGLSGLAEIPTLESLKYVTAFLDDNSLREEASAAATQIAGLISDLYPQEVDAVMKRILAVTQMERTRRSATFIMSPDGRKQATVRRGRRTSLRQLQEPD